MSEVRSLSGRVLILKEIQYTLNKLKAKKKGLFFHKKLKDFLHKYGIRISGLVPISERSKKI